MTRNKVKTKKKVNSYLKFLLWMAFGGVVGAAMGFGASFSEEGLRSFFENARVWIGTHIVLILAVFLVTALVVSVVCYRKGEVFIRLFLDSMDDDQQDELEQRFDFWSNIGMTTTSILIYLSIAVFAFGLWDRGGDELVQLLLGAVLFLVTGVICGFYQVAAVRQVQKKDPMKRGDAADIRFEKDWLGSCDEVEKRIIYEAGYKAFSMTRMVIMIAMVFCIIGQLYFGGCLTAIVMLTLCNIISTIIYTCYATKLGKAGLH